MLSKILLTFTTSLILTAPFFGNLAVLGNVHVIPPQTSQQDRNLPRAPSAPRAQVRSIRSIDFANFTYPGIRGEYRTPFPARTFILRNRHYGTWRYGMSLRSVSFGDVTGDGEEEAILNFDQDTEGSAANSNLYIYTMEHNRPRLLWAFMSGDRADGGLRRAFAENGVLVVELFGIGTRIEGEIATQTSEAAGMCCPRSFTRTRYEWRDRRFRQQGVSEVLPNPMAQSNCPTCLPEDRSATRAN